MRGSVLRAIGFLLFLTACVSIAATPAQTARDASVAAGENEAETDRKGAMEEAIPHWNLPDSLENHEIQDLYKHLHQAYMGPGHAIPSQELAESHLAREWSELGAARPGEEPLELLVAGAPFVRVHLRPYRDRGGSMESILDSFLLSGDVPCDSMGFVSAWSAAGEAIIAGRLPFERAEFDALDSVVRDSGYPAVHHSGLFRRAYRPAYRVLSRQEAEKLLSGLKKGATAR